MNTCGQGNLHYNAGTLSFQITKKLAGADKQSAAWCTDVGNEVGEILTTVFTASEGEGLRTMCQGLVRRYQVYNQPEPRVLYVDHVRGGSKVTELFTPWKTAVRLDVWHFMRRLAVGVVTDSHILYAPFMSQLSDCIFEWHQKDTERLLQAKKAELQPKMGLAPTEE